MQRKRERARARWQEVPGRAPLSALALDLSLQKTSSGFLHAAQGFDRQEAYTPILLESTTPNLARPFCPILSFQAFRPAQNQVGGRVGAHSAEDGHVRTDRASSLPAGPRLHPRDSAHQQQGHPPVCVFPRRDAALGPERGREP